MNLRIIEEQYNAQNSIKSFHISMNILFKNYGSPHNYILELTEGYSHF